MPAYPIPPDLALDDWAPFTAFDLIYSILKADTTLQSIKTTVVTYRDGYDKSEINLKEPDFSLMPLIRLKIPSFQSGWENEIEHNGILRVGLTLFTGGPKERNIMNFMGAISNALFGTSSPTNRSNLMNQYRSVPGLIIPQVRSFAANVHTIGQSAHGLKAEANVSLTMLIAT